MCVLCEVHLQQRALTSPFILLDWGCPKPILGRTAIESAVESWPLFRGTSQNAEASHVFSCCRTIEARYTSQLARKALSRLRRGLKPGKPTIHHKRHSKVMIKIVTPSSWPWAEFVSIMVTKSIFVMFIFVVCWVHQSASLLIRILIWWIFRICPPAKCADSCEFHRVA